MKKHKDLKASVDNRVKDVVLDPQSFEEFSSFSDDTSTLTESEEYQSCNDRPKRQKPVQFPTGKPNRYSKDRRYIPISKKSDSMKVKCGSRKGSKTKKKNISLNEDYRK